MQRRIALVSLIAAVFCGIAGAQGVMTTFAGTDWVFPGDGKPALRAPLGQLTGITVDSAGNPIVVDSDNSIVAWIRPDGILSVIAGNGIGFPPSGEGGPATSAALYIPLSAAIDPQGNLYLGGYSQIRKVSAGIITLVAGRFTVTGFTGDGGPATNAQISSQGGIATDASGTIYFADTNNNRVRKITPSGTISTVAGNGTSGFSGDGGLATDASLQLPLAVTLDKAGNLYIADSLNHGIRKVTAAGVISTVVSNPSLFPVSIAFDNAGVLYIGAPNCIYKMPPGSSTPTLIAGNAARYGYSGDGGLAINALFGGLVYVAPDNRGNLYVADKENFRVRKISPDGIITTIAGNGGYRYAGENVLASASPLNGPQGLALDSTGNLYFSEFRGHRVRKVSGGFLTTFAGTGGNTSSGDGGPAIQADLRSPAGLAFDSVGNLYVSSADYRIRKVTSRGIISTYASGFSPDGLAFDSAGNLYASTSNMSQDARVRKIDPKGNVTVYAGTGAFGYSGDGGPATSAMLNYPRGLVVDAAGNLLVADSGNRRVRKITPRGIITTIAGNGAFGSSGDGGLATQASLGAPFALTFDSAGNLYIADWGVGGEGRIRRVTPSGIISTFAGGGPGDLLGDGKVATAATLHDPCALAFDAAGNLFIAECTTTNRVRVVLATPPTIRLSQSSLSFSAASGGPPSTQTLSVQGSVSGLDFQVNIENVGRGNWLTADATAASTPRLLSFTADPTNMPPGRYNAIVTITPAAAVPAKLTVKVAFVVGAAQAPQLAIDHPNLSFTFPRGAAARSTAIKISNTGGGALKFGASASSVRWLSLSPASGEALPGKPATLTVTANPAGLNPNTYTGSVSIKSSAGNGTIPVTITVSSLPQALLLTQTGMSFTAVEEGGVVPSQSFGIVNAGTGALSWVAGASTLSGGDWLSATPAKGTSDAFAAVPQVTVRVNAAGLTAERSPYYGLVRIRAPGAANTPRVVTVVLEVLPAGQDPGAVVRPSELVFSAMPGAGFPGSQTLLVYNIGATPKTYHSGRTSQGALLFAVPQEGALDPSQPSRIIVQPAGNFPAGASTGALTFQFSDGRVESVKITTISVSEAGSRSGSSREARLSDASFSDPPCPLERLLPTLTTLGQSFAVSAGWPVALVADVRDNCGNPHVSGRVTVSFSDGEDAVPLTSLKDGTWQGTWPTPSGAQSQVTLTVDAVNPQLGISGFREINGQFRSQKEPPAFTQGSIVSAASRLPFQALAPGSFISIDGDRLAENSETAKSPTWPIHLNGTRVLIADKNLPLHYVSEKQIEALVPFGIEVNTEHEVLIQRGLTYSRPVPVNVAAAQPGILITEEGYGFILADRRDGTNPFQVSPESPATQGDLLTIYCAGLGVTFGFAEDGAPSPAPPPETTQTPTVTIDGKDAPVSFSGLVPGFVGIYQVQATMPSEVTPGDDVKMTLSIAGQTGPAANLAVR